MSIISVDNNKVVGVIKPVHSVVSIPTLSARSEIKWSMNILRHIDELGMPYSRFNGVGGAYGSMTFVDVSNIFRDFDADEFDGANYDFTFTDWLVRECVSRGVKPIYRLGVSKETDHWLKAYNIYPPKDYAKFARICERIILHYNSGWNGGFKSDIKYWEIWDGPDNAREIKDNACWKGTKLEYFEFYSVVSKHLKNRFPNLMFGGYGASGFDLENKKDYTSEFFKDFLEYITAEKTKSPFDFFTWNSISSSPETNTKVAKFVREKLDCAGLTACESICGSWNSGIADPSKFESASIIGANLIAWQNSDVNIATYDNCVTGEPCGLFAFRINAQNLPSYGYYVMKAFNTLYKLGFQVKSVSDDQYIQSLCAINCNKFAMLVVNTSKEEKVVEVKTIGVIGNKGTATEIKQVDKNVLSLEQVIVPRRAFGPFRFTMQPKEVRLYEFE